jgi:hypothetical protein
MPRRQGWRILDFHRLQKGDKILLLRRHQFIAALQFEKPALLPRCNMAVMIRIVAPPPDSPRQFQTSFPAPRQSPPPSIQPVASGFAKFRHPHLLPPHVHNQCLPAHHAGQRRNRHLGGLSVRSPQS